MRSTDSPAVPFSEFQQVATRVRNWGRWGADDEVGALNLITPDVIRASAELVTAGRVLPLGMKLHADGVWSGSSFRRNPQHLFTVDGGDSLEAGHYLSEWLDSTSGDAGFRAFAHQRTRYADDVMILNLQSSTQWDALAHVWYDGQLYNGYPASSVTSRGATRNGIEKTLPKGIVSRGVLIDVARHKGVEHLAPYEPIFAADLDAAAAAQGVHLRSGDVLLVRTGWLTAFTPGVDATSWRVETPGLHWTCAEWLHANDVAAVAADNLSVETMSRDVEDAVLPLHLLCLRDMGVMFGELWDLEALAADCADDGRYEFQLIANSLNIPGAVGSPLNPIALK